MRTLMASLAIVTLVACGGSDKDPGTVNPQSARTSINQVGQVNAAMAASNGGQAASAVAAMTAAGQGIVTPAGPSGLIGLAPAELPRPLVLAAQTGTATCSPTSCTFTNFGDDTPGSAWTIDGTITKSGDTITFDLTYDIESGGQTVNWNIDGSVAVTATSIDGTVNSNGSATGGPAGGVSWDVSVRYDAVQLDGTGCPIGGSVTASTSYEAAGRAVYNVEGTVSFGPACGQTS
jgi:hypothetical protein